jgi:hypothetical protein
MAVRYEEGKTAKGAPLLRMFVSGKCTLAEASTLDDHLNPGKPYHRQRVVVFVAAGTEYTPDARKYFPTLQSKYHAMATVVTSTIVRAAINLMLRVSGGSRNFRMFNDEAEALKWLDEVQA